MNERLENVPTFENEYQDFAPLKRVVEAVFVESWGIYTKQVTDNLITHRLQKYPTEKLATAATEDAHMDIDSETTADRRQLQDFIKNKPWGITKSFVSNSIASNTLLT